jgi:hypothetical protein
VERHTQWIGVAAGALAGAAAAHLFFSSDGRRALGRARLWAGDLVDEVRRARGLVEELYDELRRWPPLVRRARHVFQAEAGDERIERGRAARVRFESMPGEAS